MATTQLSTVIHYLRRSARLRDGSGETDGRLLESFIARRDEVAFEALVGRHGPMVLGVCRRVLGNLHDSEDAFQATFLVLARKAASVRPRELVGNWLYGVAYRTALEARAANARRRARERQVHNMPEPAAVERERWLELQPLLDQELARLPDKYRVPVVFCELEGRPRKEVARQLGIPEGTLSSRLASARKLLASRLARRGLALPAGALAVLLSENGASAGVPATLMVSTVKAAALVAAGETAAAGLVSAEVVALAKGVMKGMFLSKLKIATAVFLALGLVGTGVGLLTHSALADGQTAVVSDPSTAVAGIEDPVQSKPAPPEGGKPRDGDKPREGDKPRDGDKPGEKGKATVGEMVTLTGTVSKEETKRKRDDGSEVAVTVYHLTDAKGNKIPLPSPRVSEGGKLLDKVDLAAFVGKEVTLTGRAVTVRTGDGADAPKRVSRVVEISSMVEISIKPEKKR